jgi:15-cis-phytoene desaturase
VPAHPWQPEGLRLQPSPYLSTYLWFDRPLATRRFWARTWAARDLNMDFYDLSRIRQGRGPDAPAWIAANAIHAVHAAEEDDDTLVRRTVDELAELDATVRQAQLVHARVHRIPMAVVCPHPGFEAARPPQATGRPEVWLAGDWTRTGLPSSMESAARSGALAAEGVAALLGRRVAPALPVPETVGLPGLLRARD